MHVHTETIYEPAPEDDLLVCAHQDGTASIFSHGRSFRLTLHPEHVFKLRVLIGLLEPGAEPSGIRPDQAGSSPVLAALEEAD